MNIWDVLYNLGFSYTQVIVSLGTFIIGFLSGILSLFFVSQKRSILGDTMAHSSLAGVMLVFLIIFQKIRLFLIAGALVSAMLSVYLVIKISHHAKLKEDVSIGIVLSFFFSIGVALLTYVQSIPSATQAGLEHYIFGNVAFLLISDLYTLGLMTAVVLLIISIFWKEYKIILFDREFAINLGIPVNFLELIMIVLVSFAVVLGIESIGVVLIAGLVIAPSVAARQWTNSYNKLILISGLIGGLSGIIGTLISSKFVNFPTGPTVIVTLSIVLGLSILFGTKNGLLINWLHVKLFHRRVNHALLLTELLASTNNFSKNNGLKTLEFTLQDYPNLRREVIDLLSDCGYCKWLNDVKCTMTYKGVQAAQRRMARSEEA